jgi:L-arabinose transport system substrate-binding protein
MTRALKAKRLPAMRWVFLVIVILGVAATAAASAGNRHASKKVTFLAAIDKLGTNPYFIQQELGMKRVARKLHFKLVVQNVESDSNKELSTLATLIGTGLQGFTTTVPDQKIGPAVIAMARKAHIPVIATDDSIKDSKGRPAPIVGISNTQFGVQVGGTAAQLYKQKVGWSESDTRIASIEQNSLSVCKQRTDGAATAFLKAVPSFSSGDVVHIAYDNTETNALDVMTTTITAHPEVKHWIMWSCNDDGVVGSVRALENAGKAPSDNIGVGLGGNLTCQEFSRATTSSFAGSYYIDAAALGRTAILELVNYIQKGTRIPLVTNVPGVFVNRANYKQKIVGCK